MVPLRTFLVPVLQMDGVTLVVGADWKADDTLWY